MDIATYLEKHFDEKLVKEVLASKKYRRILPTHKRGELIGFDTNIAYVLYDKYKMPFYKIAMLYGISDNKIKLMIEQNHKLVNRGHYCGANSQNNYFENIDSQDKAYYLGFIFADGAIVKNKKSESLRIEIHKKDKYILEQLIKYANFNTKIIDSKDENTCFISINSKKVCDDLRKHNIIQNKCNLDPEVPELREDLIIHFIRGFFDGDGIAFTKPCVGFCGSHNVIEFVRNYFVNNYNLNSNKVTYNRFNHIYYVQWSQLRDIKTFFKIMYANKSDLYLERKYIKIKNNLAPKYGDIL